MILCPYCGETTNSKNSLMHGGLTQCEKCGNYIRVLLLKPSAWERMMRKLGMYKFLYQAVCTMSDGKFSFCRVCETPSFVGEICRSCLTCPVCKEVITLEGATACCTGCSFKCSKEEFIDKKKVLEEEKW